MSHQDTTTQNLIINKLSSKKLAELQDAHLIEAEEVYVVNDPLRLDLSNLNEAGQAKLDAKANLASPDFTGVPTAPTATEGTDTTQIATTAFVKTAVSSEATRATEAEGALDERLGEVESDIEALETNKQDKLTAGDGIDITNNTVSLDVKNYESDSPISLKTTSDMTLVGANMTVGDGLSIGESDVEISGVNVSLSGNVTAPTPAADNNSTKVATTAFVKSDVLAAKNELDNAKADKANTLEGYGIEDAYTKIEIDSKLSSVYKYKGSVNTYADLPDGSEGHERENGDVWNIKTADVEHDIKAGDNVAWVALTSEWDVLAGTIDLSAYSTTTQMNAAIAAAVLTETTERQEADATINGLIGTGFDSENTVAKKLSDETDTRLNADSTLQTNINTVASDLSAVKGRVTTLETTVGNSTSGLVKDVADLDSTKEDKSVVAALAGRVEEAEGEIDTLQSEVEDETNGLIKKVADLTTSKEDTLTGVKLAAVTSGINEEKVTAYDAHLANTVVHVTQADKNNWNGKADQTDFDALEGRVTTAEEDIDALEVTVGDSSSGLVKAVATNTSDIATINGKIPAEATSTNQLADKAFVNSSIATSTATFIGTFDTLEELQRQTADENDYGFVRTVDSAGNTIYNRYKFSNNEWKFEYSLNNSSFTAEQWASINSGATATRLEEIEHDIDTNATDIAKNATDITTLKTTKTNNSDFIALQTRVTTAENDIDAVENRATVIEGKIPTAATSTNQLTDKAYVDESIDNIYFFKRGVFARFAEIPTNPTEYWADFKGNKTPLQNDWIVVQQDENYDDQSVRYVYRGVWEEDKESGWIFEYVNEVVTFTQAEEAALHSGINTTLVGKITNNEANITALTTSLPQNYVAKTTFDTTVSQLNTSLAGKQNILTSTQEAAVNSGIDSTKVAKIATNEGNIETINSKIPLVATSSNKLVDNDSFTTALAGKQDKLSDAQMTVVNSGLTAEKVAKIDTIDTIVDAIPSTASGTNKLVDNKTFTDAIQTATANFKGAYNDWTVLPTSQAGWGGVLPTKNDYMVILNDTTSGSHTGHDGECWRYKYTSDNYETTGNEGWSAEYRINETAMTQAQLAALNSGITSEKVTEIANYTSDMAGKQNVLTAGINITIDENTISSQPAWGTITGTLSSQTDLQNALNGKQNEFVVGSNEYNAIHSGINSTLVATFNAKQDALSVAQQNAVNSGITADKVAAYDSLSATIASKQNALDATQIAAVNSGINSDLVTQIALNKQAIGNKQDALSSTQMSALEILTPALVTQISTNQANITTNTTNIATINGKLSTISSTDIIASQAYVNDKVQAATASFRGTFNTVTSLPTEGSGYAVDIYGSTTPIKNDYCVILTDENHNNETWRYRYVGVWATDGRSGWTAEYRINETAMTAEQTAALNSGINAAKVSTYDSLGSRVTMLEDGTQAKITGAATTITTENLTHSKVLVSNSEGKVAVSEIGMNELNTALSGFDRYSSPIQTQLNDKIGNSNATITNATLNGTVTVPTQVVSTSSTAAASTAFVKACVPASVGNAKTPVYTNASGVVTACALSFDCVDELPANPDANTLYFIKA